MTNENWFCSGCGKLVFSSQKKCPVCGTLCKGLTGIHKMVNAEVEQEVPIVRNKTEFSCVEQPTKWDVKYDPE